MEFRKMPAVFCTLLLLYAAGFSQGPDVAPSGPAKIKFSYSFPGAVPSNYTIAVDSTGHGEYESAGGDVAPQRPSSAYSAAPGSYGDGEAAEDASGETYKASFELPEASKQSIFSMAAAANYFNGNFDYKKKKLANTGAKTLEYSDGDKHFETNYNYSTNAAVTQLTQRFQGLSATLESGRRLAYLYRHNRLGLDEELKRADELSQSGQFAEIGVLGPVLRQIASDSSVMHVAQQHARKLLERATSENQSPRK
jgi:hypothetical protein